MSFLKGDTFNEKLNDGLDMFMVGFGSCYTFYHMKEGNLGEAFLGVNVALWYGANANSRVKYERETVRIDMPIIYKTRYKKLKVI